QGADRIVEECVRHGKRLPDYSRSDDNQVWLTLDGEIRDEKFLKYLERVGEETLDTLDPHDFLVLSAVAEGKRLSADLQRHVPALVEKGLLERIGRGKPILARRLYEPDSETAVVRRQRQAAREQHKKLLLDHIEQHKSEGSPLQELTTVAPALTKDQVKALLKELRSDGLIRVAGRSRNARWYPAAKRRFGSRSSA
ncbi:MAG TPA: transcriptional regulator, partial [Phycisphaerae bacterium]|nr:transcriptional regulator [Phycisphaerae bacterium]